MQEQFEWYFYYVPWVWVMWFCGENCYNEAETAALRTAPAVWRCETKSRWFPVMHWLLWRHWKILYLNAKDICLAGRATHNLMASHSRSITLQLDSQTQWLSDEKLVGWQLLNQELQNSKCSDLAVPEQSNRFSKTTQNTFEHIGKRNSGSNCLNTNALTKSIFKWSAISNAMEKQLL